MISFYQRRNKNILKNWRFFLFHSLVRRTHFSSDVWQIVREGLIQHWASNIEHNPKITTNYAVSAFDNKALDKNVINADLSNRIGIIVQCYWRHCSEIEDGLSKKVNKINIKSNYLWKRYCPKASSMADAAARQLQYEYKAVSTFKSEL